MARTNGHTQTPTRFEESGLDPSAGPSILRQPPMKGTKDSHNDNFRSIQTQNCEKVEQVAHKFPVLPSDDPPKQPILGSHHTRGNVGQTCLQPQISVGMPTLSPVSADSQRPPPVTATPSPFKRHVESDGHHIPSKAALENPAKSVQPKGAVAVRSASKSVRPAVVRTSRKPCKRFAPLKPIRAPRIVPAPLVQEGRSAEKPLRMSDGMGKAVRLDIIKTSFLERLYRANKLASGRSITASSLAFSGISHRLLFQDLSSAAFNVVLRWVIGRIHTCLQLGNWDDPVALDPVAAVEELGGGLWVLSTEPESSTEPASSMNQKPCMKGVKRTLIACTQSKTSEILDLPSKTYLVIGETGDVVAIRKGSLQRSDQASVLNGFKLRNDWKAYIKSQSTLASMSSTQDGLDSQVQTKNMQNFPHGISRAWRDRISDECSRNELEIAKRYVLSNVVLNR